MRARARGRAAKQQKKLRAMVMHCFIMSMSMAQGIEGMPIMPMPPIIDGIMPIMFMPIMPMPAGIVMPHLAHAIWQHEAQHDMQHAILQHISIIIDLDIMGMVMQDSCLSAEGGGRGHGARASRARSEMSDAIAAQSARDADRSSAAVCYGA